MSNKREKNLKRLFIIIFSFIIFQQFVFFLLEKRIEYKAAIYELEKYRVDIDRLSVLQIDEIFTDSYSYIFDKDYIFDDAINSEDKVYSLIIKKFDEHKESLEEKWGISNEDLLLTLFFMNISSNLWGFGNVDKTDLKGCVFNNEEFINEGSYPSVNDENIGFFIYSNIGCCVDHANIMHLLLDKAGIKNRFVANSGHVFNEAFIKNEWMAFDATVNFWWHDSWENIQNSNIDKNIRVTMFQNYGTISKNKNYRSFMARFRNFMLLEAVYKTSKDIIYSNNIDYLSGD